MKKQKTDVPGSEVVLGMLLFIRQDVQAFHALLNEMTDKVIDGERVDGEIMDPYWKKTSTLLASIERRFREVQQ